MIPTGQFKIGIFDSGVGGLSVLKAIRALLPHEPIVYIADQAHVPYGSRTLEQVQTYSIEITKYLISQGVQIVVVACNTASAAALYTLRNLFPQTPFVGMEPAIKPAAESTQSRVVGVLATPATFQGQLYLSLLERFAEGVQLIQDTCPGLVEQIESGKLRSSRTRTILENALHPMILKNVDTIVLGCTHYPFVIPLIQEIVGENITVIDPAPAVARQTRRILEQSRLQDQFRIPDDIPTSQVRYLTSDDPEKFAHLVEMLITEQGNVEKLYWLDDKSLFRGENQQL